MIYSLPAVAMASYHKRSRCGPRAGGYPSFLSTFTLLISVNCYQDTHRGRDRSHSNHQPQPQQLMDHDAGIPEYYNLTLDDHHHHHHHPPPHQPHHHQGRPPQQQYEQPHYGRGRTGASDVSLMQLSPRALAEREKRMQRMMAAGRATSSMESFVAWSIDLRKWFV